MPEIVAGGHLFLLGRNSQPRLVQETNMNQSRWVRPLGAANLSCLQLSNFVQLDRRGRAAELGTDSELSFMQPEAAEQ